MQHTFKTYQPEVIFYHNPCPDGFGAYVISKLKLLDKCIYIPYDHNDDVPDLIVAGRRVMMIDCCYDKVEKIRKLLDLASSVYILDHHQGNKDKLYKILGNKADEISFFDTNKSGIRLAWEFFNENYSAPAIVHHVEDRDLHRFQYINTKSFCAYLDFLGFDYNGWCKLFSCYLGDQLTLAFSEKGEDLLKYFEKLAEDITKLSFWVTLPEYYGGHKVLFVNIGKPFNSEVPHLLLKRNSDVPFVVAFSYEEINGELKVRLSFRSLTFDVINIAQKFGGNGHPQAAGAIISAPLFNELLGKKGNVESLYDKLTHEDLMRYLINKGWNRVYQLDGSVVYRKDGSEAHFATSLIYSDYKEALIRTIERLVRYENRTPAQILQDIVG